MNKLKPILKAILCMVYGGISGFFTPTFLLMAFNFMDGIKENPEDEMFIPFGIGILLAFLIVDIVIIVKTMLSKSITKGGKALIIALFIIIKAGSVMANQLGLQLFIECFQWKLEYQWLV